MRWLSLQPSDPGYYIEDCQILRLYVVDLLQKWALSQNRKIVSECMVVGQWHYRKLQRFPPKIKSWSSSHIRIMFCKIFGEKLTCIFLFKKPFVMIHYFQDLFYFTLNLDKLRVHLECVILQQHWCTMLVFEEILSSGNEILPIIDCARPIVVDFYRRFRTH